MAIGTLSDRISRRSLLVGGGIGAGLLLAWSVWPRSYPPNLKAAPGESLFNAFLKIGSDGRIIVAIPQAEIGQGVYTSLPQILADELGADWRTVAVEAAPLNPLYANPVAVESFGTALVPSHWRGLGAWAVREYAMRNAIVMTGGSTSVRAFEARLREAGAGARALLMKAAAERWDVDWETLDTAEGFVLNGAERISFGELADDASEQSLPDELPIRGGVENRLVGRALPRLDLPSKVDGTANFAADVRLPGMVFASVRQGPIGDSTLVRINRAAGEKIPDVIAIIENPRWVAAVGTNWWAADQALHALRPTFRTNGPLINSERINAALDQAMKEGDAEAVFTRGDVDDLLESGSVLRASYSAGVAANAPIEPLTATARISGDRLEIWAPTQSPAFARAAAARVAGLSEARVTIYPMLIGGGYGRKMEVTAIEQAAIIAKTLDRPVQLTWSRVEETMQDSFRPPARAAFAAAVQQGGIVAAWHARIVVPATPSQVIARTRTGEIVASDRIDPAAAEGGVPPYTIPNLSIEHVPVDVGLRTGLWRSGAHSYTAFFTECFVDELARKSGIEPLSFRMQMLGDNARLARCLSTAAALGGWDGGGSGSAMGLAAHSCFGSHVAALVEISIDEDQRIRVARAVAVVDCGRMVNPDIVKQLIEGGIIHGISGATSRPIQFANGFPDVRGLGGLTLPRLSDTPEIMVEIMENDEEPGGVTELGIPTVAPAIANAVFSLTGRRLRSLPLVLGSQ